MATAKKKTTKKEEITSTGETVEELAGEKIEAPVESKPVVEAAEKKTPASATETKSKKTKNKAKYEIGSIVYIVKEAEADLNGFNLSISQYKKDPYTVEAYDDDTGVYTLRRSKLLIKLTEAFIVSPDERAHDSINRRQF